jgi:two-component system cell cycle sensor histidine kinase/response regulator CckA
MNEERLRQALDVAGVGVFDHDHRTGDIWWSTRMRTILGVGDEPSRSTIDRYLAVVHPDDRDAVTAAIREAHESNGDGQFDVEHRLCRHDGQVRWVSLHARTSFEGSGNSRQPERTVGTILDITERKQAEAFAHGAHQQREDLIATIDGIVWEADASTFSFTFVSAQAERLLGYPTRRWVEEPTFWLDHMHPDDRDEAKSFCLACTREGRDHQFDYRMRAADGRIVWLHDVVTVISEAGRPVKLRGVMVDITGRKDAEAARERTQALLSSIVEHSPAIVFVKEAVGLRFVLFNRAAEAVVGRSRDEVLGRTDHELFPIAQADRYVADDRLVLDSGRILEIPEEPVESVTHGRRYLRTWKVPILDGEGRPQYLLGLAQDITEQKKLAEQLRHAQKMEALGQLAGGVAHDFNNLLTIIAGYSDLLLSALPPSAPMRHEVEEIRSAGEKAAWLTSQLLAFSRKQVLQPRVLDLSSVVEESERLLRRVIGADVSVRVHRGPGPFVVKADPGQLWQVLLNLALNARDAMAAGGALEFQTAAVWLDAAAVASREPLRAGRHVVLSVSDSGCGMPASVRDRVFEPFFTTKPTGKGTGLGLAVVHGIVTQSGGYIEVDSEVDRGTVFRIYLPAFDAEPMSMDAIDAAALPGGRETILLVEDEEAVRRLAVQVLERAGYHVVTAADAADALRLTDEHDGAFDLLLTDVVMPGMSGTQLGSLVTAHYPGIKVLFVSGYTPDAVLRDGVQVGTFAFLQKPFSPAALANKVREVLDTTRPSV